MIKDFYKTIGVMSGTSLDGIDLVLASFFKKEQWEFKIHKAITIDYPEAWRVKLKNLITYSKEKLNEIDHFYALYLAECIQKFMTENNCTNVDLVSSHGHTALHQPEKSITYQIGNLPVLAKILNKTVVCDFRVQDVALGGEGAPLVPIGDELLFSKYDYCLNLGGFSNVSFQENNNRTAFDICPVNIVLNHYVSKLGFTYDNQGNISKTGNISKQLLEELNQLEFYHLTPPKSLGLEWVQKNVIPIIDQYQLEIKDILKTYVEHIAIQISKVIHQENSKTLVTGGGAHHFFLIERINAHSNSEMILPTKQIIDYKEALIFGFLGVLKIRNENNCLSQVTGAAYNHSSGRVFLP